MRVLFLAENRPDYLQAIVYHGLVQLLGAENVIDYPPVDRFHEKVHEDRAFPMLSFDYPRHGETTLEELIPDVDAVVVGAISPSTTADARTILERRSRPVVAVIDGDDGLHVRGIVNHADVYFKRETLRRGFRQAARMPARRLYHRAHYPDRWRDPYLREVGVATALSRRTVPLPYGIIDVGYEPVPLDEYDVAFFGWPSNPVRVAVMEQLEQLRSEGVRVAAAFGTQEKKRTVIWRDYMRALSASRIGISLPGLGQDTYRYWEVPYAGSLLLGNPPATVIPQNFRQGEEAIFARPEHMGRRVLELLESDTRPLADAGRSALLRFHTSVHRATTVLEHLTHVRGRRSRA
jgi:hypothetical protein